VNGPGYIVMAVYRPDAALLARQLASLQLQTHGEWTCLVGVDGTDSATVELVGDLVGADHRFCVREYAENVGVYRHFERLLREVPATAPWVALADQDDYWYPRKLEALVPLVDSREISAATGQALLVDRTGDITGITERRPGTLSENLLRNQVTGSFVVLRSDVVQLALPFPAATGAAMHDHWLGVCAAAMGRIAVVETALQDYVQHERNLLGEPRPTPVGRVVGMAAKRGIVGLLDHASQEHWEWRVSMARAVTQRNQSARSDNFVRGVADARVSRAVVGEMLRVAARRRHSLRGTAHLLVAAGWRHVRGS